MKNFIHNMVDMFGFDNLHDFATSMVHFQLLKITIPLSFGLSAISCILGFEYMTTIAFFIMVIFELISGLTASIFEGKKIESRKFSRFGFKLLTWLILMGVLNVFTNQYSEGALGWFMSTLGSTVVGYIMFEYILSIVENLERITGKEIPLKKVLNDVFSKLVNKKEK
jgi:uncharacterized membrane protein YkvI